ncbi:MAG: prepilin peptidase [Gammaproteobacteria bacterium]|nr:prepilin peptidase [Gammaproteobacteria bacterium]MCW8972835.1 prepilin peptidase [Gammaproteobacteria bacterium]MCW8992092.1 prepilin peptidase [Gammaproteobacteria bacterium]
MAPLLITVVLLLLLLIAAVADTRKHRIPNVISLAGWILAPLLHALAFGTEGFFSSLLALAVTLVLTFPLYALHWMGAGDVKLMVSVGAFLGDIQSALLALLFIVITGALFSLAIHLYKTSLSATLARLRAMISLSLSMRRPVYVPPGDATATLLIPYAVPIALGTLLFLFYARWEIPGF